MNKERILIVDDEADIALILKLQLEDSGYRTVRARDGIEALEQLARDNFSLMLLDVKMPRMNGMEVLDRVRHEFPDTGVVMMTAHGSETIAVEAMKKGAIDYISKPFSTDDLVKKIERALQNLRTRQENLRLSQQLLAEQQKMGAILRGMADILIAVDRKGRIITANHQAEMLFGKEQDKLLGMPVEELLKADIPPERLPCMVVLNTSAPALDVSYNIRWGKKTIPVLSSATPLLDHSLHLCGSLEIIRDISTLKALEQEREDFVSMLSHDLKTPITAIVGSLDLVRDGRLGSVNSEQREYLDSAVESCTEMVDMIDTLLDIHKFEAGKMVMVFKAEDLNQLIQKTISRFRPMADRADIKLFATVKEPLPQLQIDRAKFLRLISNLISNSLKFTPDGGEIEIGAALVRATNDLKKRIPEQNYPTPELPAKGRVLQIFVRDTGSGIAQEDLVTIFDRFVQARTRRKGKSGGSGLGLAFCRKVMDAHHGYIWAESQAGKGSTFFILIPLE
ncbi:MAG TPA: response regulator [Geobacteraceae bacterium]|nr:response regulator [Geobacteraceae bacterium]